MEPIARPVAGRAVWPVGLGGAWWSIGDAVDEARSIRTIHAALDLGANLIDTAAAYTTADAARHNETLIARALRQHPGADPMIVTKGGHVRVSADEWIVDGTPEALAADCDASLSALGVDAIDLYLLHKVDPAVPLEESVGALDELRRSGKVRAIGLSNVSGADLDRALAVAGIDAVENEFSALNATHTGVARRCEELGIAFLAYSPLGGASRVHPLREAYPRTAAIAAGSGHSLQRVLLAWVLKQSSSIIAIAGANRPETAVDSLAAPRVHLTDEAWSRIEDELARPRAIR
ncbi:hypothetical protein ASF30_04465 [Leifsonia sp. Leaf264]|nr:hypothetical protein ASF30_04465 [Leifsonia sp. Leaf264]